jgi:hypothetical protein
MSNKVEYKSCRTQDHGDQEKHKTTMIIKNTRSWRIRGTQDHGDWEEQKTMTIKKVRAYK